MTSTSTDAAQVRDQSTTRSSTPTATSSRSGPLLHDEIITYLEEAGGAALRDRFLASTASPLDTSTSLANRDDPTVRDQWRAMPSWWGWQTHNVRDRATSHLPALLYERLDELGIDFTILYPSMALGYFEVADEELSSALCRAVNRYTRAACSRPTRDRCTVGAMVPMNTPEQAIAEARVRGCGAGRQARCSSPGTPSARSAPTAYRLDMFGIDSEHDYDPFWAKCVELGVAPVVHSSLQSHRVTRSISNYVYNHINGLSAAHESLCKSLFLGGVTRRFPDAAHRLPRGRRRVGVRAVRRARRALGEAQPRRDRHTRPRPARRRRADGVLRALRRRRRHGRASTTSARTSRARRRSPRSVDEFARVRDRTGPTTCAPCSSPASTSGAKPTTRSWRGRSART